MSEVQPNNKPGRKPRKEDRPSEDSWPPIDPTALYAQLGGIFKRLGQNDSDIVELRTQLTGFAQQVKELGDEVRQGFASIRRGTDWPTLGTWAGVIVVVLVTIGNLALSPMREAIRANTVGREQMTREIGILQERTRWTIYLETGILPDADPAPSSPQAGSGH